MNKVAWILMVSLLVGTVSSLAGVKVIGLKGTVTVRHGVEERWTPVAVGDVLKPDDSIELGKNSTTTILVDGQRKLVIPEQVIINLSDLRNLTQEEFLLVLSMEQIRAIPPRQDRDEFNIPRTTTVHGASRSDRAVSSPVDVEPGVKQLQGARVLFDYGYYATCVLRAKSIFRLFPTLAERVDARLMVADALEKMNVPGEALSDYQELSKKPLPQPERRLVEQKIAQLKSKTTREK